MSVERCGLILRYQTCSISEVIIEPKRLDWVAVSHRALAVHMLSVIGIVARVVDKCIALDQVNLDFDYLVHLVDLRMAYQTAISGWGAT